MSQGGGGKRLKPPSLPLLTKFEASSEVFRTMVSNRSETLKEVVILDGRNDLGRMVALLPPTVEHLEYFTSSVNAGVLEQALEAVPCLQTVQINLEGGAHAPSVSHPLLFIECTG